MTLRIGILGAARIAPAALIRPARAVDEVEVVAVAARDRARAERYAAKHHIPRVFGSYDELVADTDVDAVYNPLPNGLHGRWTIAAIEAGKHVLCEKPFTANADEARAVAKAAEGTGLVVMEAFHYRYHPVAARLIELCGEVAPLRRIETRMCIPLLREDIRWQLGLAGGSTMDVGCYTLHLWRTLAGEEPAVERAVAEQLPRRTGIDRLMVAHLRTPSGVTGTARASMLSRRLLSVGARVEGQRGSFKVWNPYGPQFMHRIEARVNGRRSVERLTRTPTYEFQLQAFAAAVLRGESFPTGLDDAIANMDLIDACYRAAGMEARQPSA